MYHASVVPKTCLLCKRRLYVEDADWKVFRTLSRLQNSLVGIMLSWFMKSSPPASPLVLNLEINDKRTFTTLERITGKLTVKALVDTSFDKIDIKLVGISRTYGRRVVPQAPNARTVTTAHRFLELTQPNVLNDFSECRVLKAGCVYEVPFEFAIPDRMLPAKCRHAVTSPLVHRLHTSMPPSFGDHELGDATDYAPRHASVKYRIVATIQGLAKSQKNREIASCSERICFRPPGSTMAPSVDDYDPARHIREEVSLRRLWKRSPGKIVVTSVQSSPFRIKDIDSSVSRSELSGQVKIELEFHPAYNGAQPPERIDLDSILRTKTTSAVIPLPQLPSEHPWHGPERDEHSAPSVILSSRAIGNIDWVINSHDPTWSGEKCPAYDVASSDGSVQDASLPHYYTTQIVASLDAAVGFSLVPTFHSCLISRAYEVRLRLSVQDSATVFGSTIRLTLPVQIVLEQFAMRRDSAVSCEDDFGLGLDWRMSHKKPRMTKSRGPPPRYESSRT
jgi:hypothetical protein